MRNLNRCAARTGVFMALLVLSWSAAAQTGQTNTFDELAYQEYQKLQNLFETKTNNWALGNAFDTMTDYLQACLKKPGCKITQQDILELMPRAYQQYYVTLGSVCWYDDYGWWGIASSKAFDSRFDGIFGDLKPGFQKIARDSWKIMHEGKGDMVHLGAPNVWANGNNHRGWYPGPPDPYFATPEPEGSWAWPRFEGGVWQYDMWHIKRGVVKSNGIITFTPVKGYETGPPECNGDTNPSNPATTKLGPFQLTEVNGLYYILASRLNPHGVDGTDTALSSVYHFLASWFNVESQTSLLQQDLPVSKPTLNAKPVLVRERVSTYAQLPDKTYPKVEHWEPKLAWGGDQGLILGTLAAHHASHPTDSESAAWAQQIVAGVVNAMTLSDGSVYPWYPTNAASAPQGDTGDYSCGSGVFMRYLLHAAGAPHSPLTDMVKEKDFENWLCKAAQQAPTQRMPPKTLAIFASLNRLATYVAVMKLAPDCKPLAELERPSSTPSHGRGALP